MRNVLRAAVDAKRDDLIALHGRLVAVPTVNPPGRHYGEMVDLLEGSCRALGLQTDLLTVPTAEAQKVVSHADEFPRYNLLARWDVGAEKTVHFNAHYDVVPVSGHWRTDPFDPVVKGDWAHGRGSDDMKDSIASLLTAISVLRDEGIDPAFNVECSFTADEEIGGDLGAGYIAKSGRVKADYVVNCEGGSGLNVGCGHNGVLWLRITVQGKAAHASNPKAGVNAFEAMARLVATLQRHKRDFDKRDRVFITPAGSERRPTINIGGVFYGTDGDKENTVPAEATFTIDRRIPPNETLADAEAELRDAVEKAATDLGDATIRVERTLGIEPCLVDAEHPFVQSFVGAVRAVRRSPVKLNTTTGFTDLHFLIEGDKPGVGYGPKGERAHGANERVSVSDMAKTARVYASFMADSDPSGW